MDGTIIEFNRCGVCHQCIISIAYLTACQQTAISMRSDGDTLPLATYMVVGQIVEHMVKTIATKQAILGNKSALDSNPSTIMEVERAILDGQDSSSSNLYAAIDDDRCRRLNGLAFRNFHITPLCGIPAIGTQVDLLLHPTLQGKQQVVLYQLRIGGQILRSRNLHKYANAVAFAYLQIISYGIEEGTINIDTETRLSTTFQAHGTQTQTIARLVMYPEAIGRRRDGSK